MFSVKVVYCQVTMEFENLNLQIKREGIRNDSQENQGIQERRKLLKRTRSLAVISEDKSRKIERENKNFQHDDTFDIPRRPQLIPRAKLIDRSSLRDRLSKSQQHLSDNHKRHPETLCYQSQSTWNLYSPEFSYLQEPSCSQVVNRDDSSDRLNILDWPRTTQRYRSHQDLDTVSGLVDIVEDNWPLNKRRNSDIYTQVKRKRKEHRSLDSILFEDDDELEYFDVLNLLPLSKVRLEFEESDCNYRNDNFLLSTGGYNHISNIKINNNKNCTTSSDADEESYSSSDQRQTPRILQVSEFSDDNHENTGQLKNNITDEDKCKNSTNKDNQLENNSSTDIEESWNSIKSSSYNSAWITETPFLSLSSDEEKNNIIDDNNHIINEDNNINNIIDNKEALNIEEAEDIKSIWISDTDEIEDMSSRPQILKIIDNDVTRSRHNIDNNNSINNDNDVNQKNEFENNVILGKDMWKNSLKIMDTEDEKKKNEINSEEFNKKLNQSSVEVTRNFFEGKSSPQDVTVNNHNEGPFERIVKETSNIIDKACNVVKGSLGFEARSESSDLGLGSDCDSDTRRRSIDDDDVDLTNNQMNNKTNDNNNKKNQVTFDFPNYENKNNNKTRTTNLTRSRSCINSIDCCQDNDGPEFDHIRYKIVKSKLFGKNIFGNIPNKGDVGYDGLMEYLREYSFQEILLDNNVVIIEPVRAQPVEKKITTSSSFKYKKNTNKIDNNDKKKIINSTTDEKLKLPKQSTLRKHFFYHPISSVNRVNRELIDEELPDPDTVRNVRKMFESTLLQKFKSSDKINNDENNTRKSVSMKDLSSISKQKYDDSINESTLESTSRSRCSSRAKDLRKLFEDLDKSTSLRQDTKDDLNIPKVETKARTIAQFYEARSGNTSPSDSGCVRNTNKTINYSKNNSNNKNKQQINWDAGSVSSGVSSDYPDTEHGSGVQCTSSDDEDYLSRGDIDDERIDVHFVSQDVLKKIRECGTSVTYYGGKVLNTCNGPLISPLTCNNNINNNSINNKGSLRIDDYVKFKLVKSNSCDSRLELAGRVIERRTKLEAKKNEKWENKIRINEDLRNCTIDESPSIEITGLDSNNNTKVDDNDDDRIIDDKKNIIKREPPVVIGLEPKKDDRDKNNNSLFKLDFKLGKNNGNIVNKFGSALTKWQINETNWKKNQNDFGKMEFEEFEVVDDGFKGNEK
ncbi:uncharacterized protein MAL13P1.304 isoform X2 [Aphidius gifuensis]|uniref:uncharacterized protein MAL13P1.304 isoform X2 n=1 Tax=Aphidius gifuensis TaxID=684658 RepID=UPI001CDCDB9B|nr:uncharacterized protein MAL13P1.304 isoform X2 [Aphidius gifuensis]